MQHKELFEFFQKHRDEIIDAWEVEAMKRNFLEKSNKTSNFDFWEFVSKLKEKKERARLWKVS